MTTLLLIDDDPFVLRVHALLLMSFGYEVVSKKDTLDALAFVQDGKSVDLVITDYRMPVIDGGDFIRALRQTLPVVPVIVLTGHGEVELDRGLGVFACLSKPVGERELERVVKTALEHADMLNLVLSTK